MSHTPVVFLIARDIKLAHSVFALPFAVFGAFLARRADEPWAGFLGKLAIVVVCMVTARTWAMLVNRLADRAIDARNPRTAGRVFASGALSTATGNAWLLASAAAFLGGCALFGVFFSNWWPAMLALPVLAWIALYSYTKRFTAWCHVFLGGALAVSPLAAAIAVDPTSVGLGAVSAVGPGPWSAVAAYPIAAMVVCWVAGFDVLYALQDLEFDRAQGLFSIPARLGERGAIWMSRLLHAAAIAALLVAARSDPRLSVLYLTGVGLMAMLVIGEHIHIARRGRAGVEMAFFLYNGIASVALGLLATLDTIW